MSVFVPNYYRKFKCIANECKHSCCIGWEIEVDEGSLARYAQLEPASRDWVFAHIATDGAPHFRLDARERCPFLAENGLCEMILTLGEASLCQICADHPRFRNFYETFTEMGLGLCCEEAARLILTEPFALVPLDTGEFVPNAEEAEMLEERERIFEILSHKKAPVSALTGVYGISFAAWEKLLDLLDTLERFDEAWGERICGLKARALDLRVLERPGVSNLAAYFIFRHFGDAMYEGNARARVAFAIFSCLVIGMLGETQDLFDAARQYSVEIEYSEENTRKVIEFFEKEQEK